MTYRIKHTLILLSTTVFFAQGSVADTMVSVSETHYDANLRPDCIAVRMNPTTFADAPSSACVPKTTVGTSGPDRIIKTTYDVSGRVLKVIQGYGTSDSRDYVSYTYNLNGTKLYEVDARSYTTQYRYDGFDRLDRIYYPCPGTQNCANGNDYEEFAYDVNGNRTSWRRRNAQTTIYTFDNLNRQIQEGGSYVADMSAGYDLQGRVKFKHFTSGGLGVDYTYDPLGRMTFTTDINGRTLAYGYNQASARTSLIYPDTSAFSIGVDALNRMGTIVYNGTNLIAQTYNNAGLRASLSRGVNAVGGFTSYTYDGANRLMALASTPVSAPYAITWTFSGRNAASQVTAWSGSSTLYDYTEAATTTVNKTFDGLNRDATIAAITGGYDANGNLAKDGARIMVYDFYNRLASVALNATPTMPFITFAYDPEGRLASYSYGGNITEFLYDGTNLIGEYGHVTGTGHTSDNMTARYIHGSGADEPLVWYPGPAVSSPRYFYANYQGSIIAWADASGLVQDYYKYDPYGVPFNNITAGQQWGGLRFRYTGQAVIKEAQLYYYKARIYDPNMGRFLQTDPVGGKDDLNLYAYVKGDPINSVDPTGLKLKFAPGTSDAFKAQFGEMVSYLNKNGTAGVFARLEKLSDTVYVKEGAQNDFYYQPSTQTMVIDPLSGLEVAPGDVQTPALGAKHEADHAYQHLTDPTKYASDVNTPDAAYDNKEEKRVIDELETPAAEKMGEPTRTNHGGTAVQVSCPTCTS